MSHMKGLLDPDFQVKLLGGEQSQRLSLLRGSSLVSKSPAVRKYTQESGVQGKPPQLTL